MITEKTKTDGEPANAHYVFYDGDCEFCLRLVRKYQPRLESRGFRFAALQEPWVTEKLNLSREELMKEMKVLTAQGQIYGGGDAVLFLMRQLPRLKLLGLLGQIPPFRGLVRRIYQEVAAKRHCSHTACPSDAKPDSFTVSLGIFLWFAVLFVSIFLNSPVGVLELLFLLAPLVLVPLALDLIPTASERKLLPRISVTMKALGFLLGTISIAMPWFPGFPFPFPLIFLLPVIWLGIGCYLSLALPKKNFYLGLLQWGECLLIMAMPPLLMSFLQPSWHVRWLFGSLWVSLCGFLTLAGLLRFLKREAWKIEELPFQFGLLFITVGGMHLIFSRAGMKPLGFEEPIVFLTAVHFHFTGFLALVLLGLVGRRLRQATGKLPRLYSWIVSGALFGIPLLALGWIVNSAALKLFAVSMLSLSFMGINAFFFPIWDRFRNSLSKNLWAISSASIFLGMIFALIYAIGEFRGEGKIGIPTMAWTHGILNGVGFVLCGLLAWRFEHRKEISK